MGRAMAAGGAPPLMQGTLGQDITTTLADPSGDIVGLGARIEVPITRAIVSAFVAATKVGALWTVTIPPPLTAGDYQFVWRTSDPEPPDFETFIPLVVGASGAIAHEIATLEQITPSVDDIGALLHARTLANGEEVGTFDDTTLPTGDQVSALIDLAVGDVVSRCGVGIPATYAADAKHLAALQTATLVEASYFPDELESDSSAYRQYQAMFLNGVESLIAAARRPGALRLV